MKNLKVSLKLIVSFLLVILLAILVGAVGIYGMSSLNKAGDKLYEENLMAINILGEIRENVQRVRVGLRNLVLNSGDIESIEVQMTTMNSVISAMNELFDEYELTITEGSDESAYFNARDAFLNEYVGFVNQVYDLSKTSYDEANALVFSDRVAATTDDIINGFTASMSSNEEWAREACDNNTTIYNTMTWFMVGATIVCAAVAMTLALYISALISKPLQALTQFMNKASSTGDISLTDVDKAVIEKYSKLKDETGQCIASTTNFLAHITSIANELGLVAEGNLTSDISTLSEKDVMGVAMKKMLSNLNHMFADIYTSTEQVSAGSKQIADGAQTLAQGSTEQAASVEELSSSINEVADKTRANAEMATRAANLGNSIKVNAEKGSTQMDQMMRAVKEISEASQSIGKVIKVIDDIAFQTNILALNAAVEAARAGQHGKGFAVVAEEVRNLAAKSAEAAKDTGSLIANSMEKAELGESIAKETAESLADIVSGINESGKIVGDIAHSSEEQAAAITQINIGIDQVAQVVQQNSATAEESAAASQEMSGQAGILGDLIAQFKLRDM